MPSEAPAQGSKAENCAPNRAETRPHRRRLLGGLLSPVELLREVGEGVERIDMARERRRGGGVSRTLLSTGRHTEQAGRNREREWTNKVREEKSVSANPERPELGVLHLLVRSDPARGPRTPPALGFGV